MSGAELAGLILSIFSIVGTGITAALAYSYVIHKRKEEHKSKGNIKIIHEEQAQQKDDLEQQKDGIVTKNNVLVRDTIVIDFKNSDAREFLDKTMDRGKKGKDAPQNINNDSAKLENFQQEQHQQQQQQQQQYIKTAFDIRAQMHANSGNNSPKSLPAQQQGEQYISEKPKLSRFGDKQDHLQLQEKFSQQHINPKQLHLEIAANSPKQLHSTPHIKFPPTSLQYIQQNKTDPHSARTDQRDDVGSITSIPAEYHERYVTDRNNQQPVEHMIYSNKTPHNKNKMVPIIGINQYDWQNYSQENYDQEE